MNKLRVLKFWPAFAVLSLLLIFTSCGDKTEDPTPTPAQLLQGTWKCQMTGEYSGYWDEYKFTSLTNASYRLVTPSGVISDQAKYTFEATETKIVFTTTDGEVVTVPYSISGNELTLDNYLYYKQ